MVHLKNCFKFIIYFTIINNNFSRLINLLLDSIKTINFNSADLIIIQLLDYKYFLYLLTKFDYLIINNLLLKLN